MKLFIPLILVMFLSAGCSHIGALCGKMQPVSDNGTNMEEFYGCGVYTGKLFDTAVDTLNSLGEEE